MPSAPQRSPQRDPFPRRPATTHPRPMAAEEAPRPLRDDIPDDVWKGFDRAIAPLRPKIRGAFRRYVELLQTAFTIEQLEAVLRRDRNLEAIVSSPDAEEMKRPAREELYDLYLGPRRQTRAERDASGGLNATRRGVEPWNAVRDQPAKAPVVRTMLATSKVAADTSEAIPRGWWNSKALETEMVRWAELTAAARVTSVTDGTRAGIRQVVTSAFDFEDGTDRDGIARALRALDGTNGKVRLGLDAPRQKTFMKFVDDYPAIPAGTPARARRMLEIRRQKALDRRFRSLLRQRADTIARTEASNVGNAGQVATWQKALADGEITGDLVLEWVTRSIRVCPRCRALDGATREIAGGQFVSDGSGPKGVETPSAPTLHPRCFPGSVRVMADDVAGAVKRFYDGRFIVLKTAGGRELTSTPNHPILTRAGWVAAERLVPGDYVLCDTRFPLVGTGGVDDQDMPPTIHEVEQALRLTSGVPSVEVPVADPDFHGDGVGSEVAVITPNRLLREDRADLSVEPVDEIALPLALVAALSLDASGYARAPVSRLGLATLSSLSCERHLPLLLWAGLLHAKSASLSPAAKFDASSSESHSQRASGDASAARYVEEGLPPEVVIDQLADARDLNAVGRADPLADLSESSTQDAPVDTRLLLEIGQALAGSVFADKVVEVRDFYASHDVYNLQTEPGWYVANGIVCHNCYCSMRTIRRQDALRPPSVPAEPIDPPRLPANAALAGRQYAANLQKWQREQVRRGNRTLPVMDDDKRDEVARRFARAYRKAGFGEVSNDAKVAYQSAIDENYSNPQFVRWAKELPGEAPVILKHRVQGGRDIAAEWAGERVVYYEHEFFFAKETVKRAPDAGRMAFGPGASSTETIGGLSAIHRHEIGHGIRGIVSRDFRLWFRDQFYKHRKRWEADLTAYATTNDSEAFSEIFALMTDRKFVPAEWPTWIGKLVKDISVRLDREL